MLKEKQSEEHRIIGHLVSECFLQKVSFFKVNERIVIDFRENFEIEIGHYEMKEKQL